MNSLRVSAERRLYRAIAANNRRIHRLDPIEANPRPIEGEAWYQKLVAAHPAMLDEWRAARAAGVRFPEMEHLIPPSRCASGEPGPYWQAGGLLSMGRPVQPVASWFPRTVEALLGVPGIESALFSIMGPGKNLGAHEGPNAGGLRFLFGIDCDEGAALEIGDRIIPYRNGEGVLFDDTESHSAWNGGTAERVVVMCDVIRPLPFTAGVRNWVLQKSHHLLIPEFRKAPLRVAELHAALNPDLKAPEEALVA